jgi:hypothetical protein
MSARRFAHLSLSEISRLAKKSARDLRLLNELLEETRFRTDFSAAKLQIDIVELISALERQAKTGANGETSPSRQRSNDGHNMSATTESSDLNVLRAELANAQNTILALQAELNTHRQSETDLLFRRVGLNKDAPPFVVRAVRLAYRKALHPDTRPDHQKKEAHQKFVDVEKVFDQLYKLRDL